MKASRKSIFGQLRTCSHRTTIPVNQQSEQVKTISEILRVTDHEYREAAMERILLLILVSSIPMQSFSLHNNKTILYIQPKLYLAFIRPSICTSPDIAPNIA